MRLANTTWPHAEAYFRENDMVLLAVGSIECHGRHLPLGTDFLIPEHLLSLIEQKSEVMITPTLPYGAAEYFADFPGTVSLGTELLYQVLTQIIDNLFQHGARRFVILNGHGGNIKSIDRAAYNLQRKGGILAELNWWRMAWDLNPDWKGGHGGGEETAAILGIEPSLVDQNELTGPLVLRDLSPEIKATGISSVQFKGVEVSVPRLVPSVCRNGWVGPDHPDTATEKWGKEMLAACADYIADFLEAFKQVNISEACKML